MTPHAQEANRPRLLFVDDEQRVLNSMRIMFHRQFELFLASHGAAALDIVKDKDIDVIVADHRMPRMTGVEVLSQVRALSPRTVRILLTGYADLDSVEGSINESEVFRFLTKPSAPRQLRETIELAAKIARNSAAPARGELGAHETLELLESAPPAPREREPAPREREPAPAPSRAADHADHAADRAALGIDIASTARLRVPSMPEAEAPSPAAKRLPPGCGVTVFSSDEHVLEAVQKAVRGLIPVYHATNIVQVVRALDEHQPGVLVTDISE